MLPAVNGLVFAPQEVSQQVARGHPVQKDVFILLLIKMRPHIVYSTKEPISYYMPPS